MESSFACCRKIRSWNASRLIVFDEFHERSLNSDLALAMVRRVQREVRPDLKLVVMSATLVTEPVAKFLGDCPVVVSEGRLHPITIEYLKYSTTGPLAAKIVPAVEKALAATGGHVLVFLPGVGEIRQVGRELSPIAERAGIEICELYGDMPLARQQEVLQPGGVRKVMLATNVAETSLTIDGVTAVVDSGLARVARIDPTTGINRLEIERISRASADQRAGRAGRTAPGVCYRLWTERDQQALAEFDQPEIARVDISGAVLELLSWGETDVATFSWFEPPSGASIEQALALLRRLGAIDTGVITAVGHAMARLPVHPRIAKLLIEGERMGVAERAAWVAAMLSERDRFVRSGPRDIAKSEPSIRLGCPGSTDVGGEWFAQELVTFRAGFDGNALRALAHARSNSKG